MKDKNARITTILLPMRTGQVKPTKNTGKGQNLQNSTLSRIDPNLRHSFSMMSLIFRPNLIPIRACLPTKIRSQPTCDIPHLENVNALIDALI